MTRLILGEDARVAEWAFATWGCQPFQINLAVGLADEQGELVGAFAFSGWNGSDAEIHVLAPGGLTRRVVRAIMGIALIQLGLKRLTVRTRKDSMARGVQKLGAKYEGTIRRLYGETDEDHHAGRQYAFFRETIARLANIKEAPEDVRWQDPESA